MSPRHSHCVWWWVPMTYPLPTFAAPSASRLRASSLQGISDRWFRAVPTILPGHTYRTPRRRILPCPRRRRRTLRTGDDSGLAGPERTLERYALVSFLVFHRERHHRYPRHRLPSGLCTHGARFIDQDRPAWSANPTEESGSGAIVVPRCCAVSIPTGTSPSASCAHSVPVRPAAHSVPLRAPGTAYERYSGALGTILLRNGGPKASISKAGCHAQSPPLYSDKQIFDSPPRCLDACVLFPPSLLGHQAPSRACAESLPITALSSLLQSCGAPWFRGARRRAVPGDVRRSPTTQR
jgi:hypothetical protein